uniref:Uncharacterized protein n=1 Tax=Anguilla anguilla TaxID=7936 RepID=A0A0E9TNH5_ANGAN
MFSAWSANLSLGGEGDGAPVLAPPSELLRTHAHSGWSVSDRRKL